MSAAAAAPLLIRVEGRALSFLSAGSDVIQQNPDAL